MMLLFRISVQFSVEPLIATRSATLSTLEQLPVYFYLIKPGFHKANFDHNNDQFRRKTKRLVGRMTTQPNNRFVFCVVIVEFAVNGNQAL